MSDLPKEFQAIIDEFRADGPHAGESDISRGIHATQHALVIAVDMAGKLDDQNSATDKMMLASYVRTVVTQVTAAFGRPGAGLLLKLFGASAIESAIDALMVYTGGIDDFFRVQIMPHFHELRELFVAVDDEMIADFGKVA